MAVAAGLLLLFTVINAFGVALFARINAALTWVKLLIPAVFIVVILASSLEPANFTAHCGFAPFGLSGIFAAVASGGVAFAFIGFRHAIDMAGETRNPQVTIPLALILAILVCFLVYTGVQIAFIGALPQDALANGWNGLRDTGSLGPLGALATALGILWLVSVINAAAVVSPFGGALVSVGSNGRLAMAIAENGFFPKLFATLNAYGVPLKALLLNFVVACVLFATMPFSELVALNSAALILSFIVGPVAVIALRRLAPDFPRSFRLPLAPVLAAVAFTIATLMICWFGWHTMSRLMLLLGVCLVLLVMRLAMTGWQSLDARGALWVALFLLGIGAVSFLGSFQGGHGMIAAPWDSLIVIVFAVVTFILAVSARLPQDSFDRYLEYELAFEIDEYGGSDPAEAALAQQIARDRGLAPDTVTDRPWPPRKGAG